MEIVDLLALFSDPSTIKKLSLSQKLTASLVTTILGMGITFLALIILQIVTSQFDKLNRTRAETPDAQLVHTARKTTVEQPVKDTMVNDELVAAVTTALAMALETSATNIIIKDIKRVADTTPVWSKAGIAEQVQNSV